jgi:hypothetical protein
MQCLGYFVFKKHLFHLANGVSINYNLFLLIKVLFLHLFSTMGQVTTGLIIRSRGISVGYT